MGTHGYLSRGVEVCKPPGWFMGECVGPSTYIGMGGVGVTKGKDIFHID